MNVNMVGTLIHREDRGASTIFYFSPSLVQLYEQSSHSKFNKIIAIEMLKTQLVFAKEFLSPAMLDPNANWNEVSMDTYQGENMYSITFSSTTSDKSTVSPKKKWWEFRKSSPLQSSKSVQEREVPQSMSIFHSKLDLALTIARRIIDFPHIDESQSKKLEVLGIIENLEAAIRALKNGKDDDGQPITPSMIGVGLGNMLEYMKQHGIWIVLHVNAPSDVRQQLDFLKDKIEDVVDLHNWSHDEGEAIAKDDLHTTPENRQDKVNGLASSKEVEKNDLSTNIEEKSTNTQVQACWSCKEATPPILITDTLYCSNCGVVLSKNEPPQMAKIETLTEQKHNCHSCKNTISPLRILGQLYCPECGVRL